MEWLAIKFRSGEMLCMSRVDREIVVDKFMREGKIICSVVEKKFANRHECNAYCDRINEVNELIKKI